MKRLFSVLIIIILFLCGTCGFLLYQNVNLHNQIDVLGDNLSECQSQIDVLEDNLSEYQSQFDQLTQLTKIKNSSMVVRVTNFTTFGLSPLVGVMVESDANITIQNLGTNDLEGLTLTVDHAVLDYVPTQSYKIESLNVGEERTVSANVHLALGSGVKVVISIMLDDIILHEHRTY